MIPKSITESTALGDITTTDPVTILAPIAAALAAIVVVYGRDHIGDDTRFWRAVRGLLPHVDEAAREHGFYTSYSVDADAEFVGSWAGSLSALETALDDRGAMPGPLAAHKDTTDGRREVGSWVYFGRDISSWPKPMRVAYLWVTPYQLHLTIFPAADGDGYDVTAHYEYSAYSPFVAYWHLRAKFYDIEAGVDRARTLLGDADGLSIPNK